MKQIRSSLATAFQAIRRIPSKCRIAVKLFVVFLSLSLVTSLAPQKAVAQVSVSFQVFYDDLSPYGNWVDNSEYGYVWVPRVSRGFMPYGTNGHWIFTNVGWTWVSNYSWGWGPFHYGRWFYDSYYGWIWVPDNEWGPGWVTWRRSEGYYGWAPIGPGISIDIAFGNNYNVPYNQWRFVRDRDFGRTDINNYYVSQTNYTTIINKSTVINNIQVDNSRNVRYNAGPDRTEVERRAGKKFTPVAIRENNRPGQNLGKGELRLYRPQVQKNVPAEHKPAPKQVREWKKDQPVRNQPVKQNPPQPVKQQPVRNPRNDQPVRQQPVKEQPVKQQPVHNPRNDQPVRQQPVKEQPVKQQPVHNPRNDQPVRQQPVKQNPPQPKKNNPPKRHDG